MDALTHKDEDLEVIQMDTDGNPTLVLTTLDIGEEWDPDAPGPGIDRELLQREYQAPMMAVPIRIVRFVFMIHTAIAGFTFMFGVVPLGVLQALNVSRQLLTYISAGISGAFGITWAIMVLGGARRHAAFIVAWTLVCPLFAGIVSVAIRNVAPLQLAAIACTQGMGMMMWCAQNKRSISPWGSFFVLLLSGLCTWGVGFYAFMGQADFVSAGVLLGCTVGFAGWGAWQVHYMHQEINGVHGQDLRRGVAHFYGGAILNSCGKKMCPPSST